jgi:hypothetical protein
MSKVHWMMIQWSPANRSLFCLVMKAQESLPEWNEKFLSLLLLRMTCPSVNSSNGDPSNLLLHQGTQLQDPS